MEWEDIESHILDEIINEQNNMNIAIIKITASELKKTANGKNVFKIKDEQGLTYSLYPVKANGNESKAYEYLKLLPMNGLDEIVEISYNEEDGEFQGKAVKYRTIVGMRATNQLPGFKGVQTTTSPMKSSVRPAQAQIQPIQNVSDYDKSAWGRCRHAYLVECMKKGMQPTKETVEFCNEWADISMREREMNTNELLKQTGGKVIDEVPMPEDDGSTYTDRGTQFNNITPTEDQFDYQETMPENIPF